MTFIYKWERTKPNIRLATLICIIGALLSVPAPNLIWAADYSLSASIKHTDITDFDLSPEGDAVVFSRKDAVYLFGIADKTTQKLLDLPHITGVAYAQSGEKIFVLQNDFSDYRYDVVAYELETRSLKWKTSFKRKTSHVISHPQINLVGVIWEKGLSLLDKQSGEVVKDIEDKIISAQLRGDNYLVYLTKDGAVKELDMRTYKETRSFKEAMTVTGLSLSEDKFVGFTGWKVYYNPLRSLADSQTFYIVRVLDAGLREVLNIKEVNKICRCYFISGSNFMLYATPGYVKCYDLSSKDPIFNIPSNSDIKDIRLSNNGSALALYNQDSLSVYSLSIAIAATKFDHLVKQVTDELIDQFDPKEIADKSVAMVRILNRSSKQEDALSEFIVSLVETELSRLRKRKKIKLLTRTEINEIIKEHKLSHSIVFDESNRAELGKLLGANFLAGGNYWQLNEQNLRVNLWFVNVESGEKVTTFKDIPVESIPASFKECLKNK